MHLNSVYLPQNPARWLSVELDGKEYTLQATFKCSHNHWTSMYKNQQGFWIHADDETLTRFAREEDMLPELKRCQYFM